MESPENITVAMPRELANRLRRIAHTLSLKNDKTTTLSAIVRTASIEFAERQEKNLEKHNV